MTKQKRNTHERMRETSRARRTAAVTLALLGAAALTASTARAAFHGWAIGTGSNSQPIVMRTTNGTDWSIQTSLAPTAPARESLTGVKGGVLWTAGDPNGGYATIYRSADQGQTWVRQGDSSSLPDVELNKIRAVNESILWSVGVSGTVLVTTNGGSDWADVSIPGVNQMLQGVGAIDAQTAWVGGAYDANGYAVIYHTTNGGANWTHQTNGGITNIAHVLGMHAIDADTVWAVGGSEQNIIQTTNAGVTWINRHQSAGNRDSNELVVDQNGTVWVATDSTIFWSDDQGSTWSNRNVADFTLDIDTPDGTNVWAVSDNYAGGFIYRTDDGGLSWSNQQPGDVVGLHEIVVFDVEPMTRYVSASSPSPMPPYTSWDIAAHTIQDAVDIAMPGDTVMVSNGVYTTGGHTNYPAGTHLEARVAIEKPITLRSVNGPSDTIIEGVPARGEFAVRCAYLTNGVTVSGFTFRYGGTHAVGPEFDRYGAGVYAHGSNVVISNCIFNTCLAERGAGLYGGVVYDSVFTGNQGNIGAGAYGSVLTRCTFRGNAASDSGGGAALSVLFNCTLLTNSAIRGGGVRECEVYGALLVGNSATEDGGGAYLGEINNATIYSNRVGNTGDGAGASGTILRNCIIVENRQQDGTLANYVVSDVLPQINNSCTVPQPALGAGNITSDPRFVDPAATNFYLLPLSPCINAGENDNWMTNAVDWAGQPRIYDSIVDMGALEWQGQVSQSAISVSGPLDFGYVTTGMTAKLTMQIHNDGPDAMQVLRVRYPDGFEAPWSGTVSSGTAQSIIVEFSPVQAIAYGSNQLIIVDSYATRGDDTTTCSGKGTVLQIPADWLAKYNLPTNRTDPAVYRDFEDPDEDTFSTWEEWRTQTDPTNRNSYFHFSQFYVTPSEEPDGSSGAFMSWNSSTNRTYTLSRTTDLGGRYPYTTVFSNRPGDPGRMEHTDTNLNAAQRYFYRIEVDE